MIDLGAMPDDAGAVTFARPGERRGFAERLADMPKSAAEFGAQLPDDSFEPQPSAIRDAHSELLQAAAEQTRLAGTMAGRMEAMADAADNRIETVQRITGVQLKNPFRQGYYMEAQQRYDAARSRGEDVGPRAAFVDREMRNIFTERLDEAASRHPDQAQALQFYQPLEAQAGAIATNAEARGALARRAYGEAGGGMVSEFLAEITGGLYGSRRDPVSVVSLVAGPAVAAGRTALARVATSALAQGFFNLGIMAIERPDVRAWRTERGQDPGSAIPSPTEVGLAFAMGAIPGAGIQSVIEAKAAGALKRVMAGEASRADLDAASRALGVKLDDDTLAMLRAGQRANEAAEAGRETPPASAEAAQIAETQALRHAADPANEPPPPLLRAVPEGTTDAAAVAHLDGAATFTTAKGSTYAVHADGTTTRNKAARTDAGHEGDSGLKPRTEKTIYVDPDVASSLSGAGLSDTGGKGYRVVVRDDKATLVWWNAEKSQWGTSDSSRDIPFTTRPEVGKSPVELWHRADDVPGAEAYRGQHAGNAIAEVRSVPAEPLARVEAMRGDPALIDSALSSNRPDVLATGKLASLSDEAWSRVRSGQATAEHGAAVADYVANPADHAAVLDRVTSAQPRDLREARLVASDAAEEFAARRSADALDERLATTVAVKPKKPTGRAAADPASWSLFELLAHEGGLRPDGELRAIFGTERGPFVPGFGALVRPSGRGLDDALRLAKDHGYMFDPGDVDSSRQLTVNINDLLDVLAEESAGRKTYRWDKASAEDRAATEAEARGIVKSLHREIEKATGERAEIDPALENRVVQIMTREGEHDVHAAYERAIMEDAERYENSRRDRRQNQQISDIPGWDAAPVSHDGGAAPRDGAASAKRSGDAGLSDQGTGGADGAQPRERGGADRGADSQTEVTPPPDWPPLRESMDSLPLAREDGTPLMASREMAAAAGERETGFADLVRSCK